MLFATLTMCTTLSLALAADAPQSDAAQAESEFELLPVEESIIHFTNLERARYGLPELQIDKRLMESARRHATWMTQTRRLQHTNQPVAENIAMGQPDSQSVLRSWMNSSGHRANILNRSHNRIGVAAYQSADGRIFWCQQFLR